MIPMPYIKSTLRPWEEIQEWVKTRRMNVILKNLSLGYALEVDALYLEEVKFLKEEYGEDLIKSQGRIYRVNII